MRSSLSCPINLILVFLLINLSSVQAQWSRLTPTPQENNINNLINVQESGRLIAACSNSTLMYSDNDGFAWNLVLNPAGMADDYLCYSLCFLNQNVGFLGGGHQSILKSTDGGISWNVKYFNEEKENEHYIFDIAFFSSTRGFAISDSGFMLKTTDAGETWNIVETGYNFSFKNIEILNDSIAFISGLGNSLLKTTDCGENWFMVSNIPGIPQGIIENMIFCNDQTGFILLNNLDYDCDIYRTNDGGDSWSMCSIDKILNIFHGKFSSSDAEHISVTGPCYSYCNIAFATSDGGDTWVTNFTPIGRGSEAICYTETNEIITGGPRGQMARSSNGMDWQRIDTRSLPEIIVETELVDNTSAYALCNLPDNGAPCNAFMVTTNRGLNWEEVDMSFYIDLFYFTDLEHGYAQGSGSLYYTADGAQSWEQVSTPNEDFEITRLFFRTDVYGFAFNDLGVYKTVDGAATWELVSPNSGNYYFTDLEYKSSDTLFLIGYSDNSTFTFKSITSGTTWELLNEVTGYPVDLCTTDSDTAFLLCENLLYQSTDNCLNWSPVTIAVEQPVFKSILFTTRNTGYIIGDRVSDNGTRNLFLKTTDRGLNWGEIETNSTSKFISIGFFDEQAGLLTGENGLILSTENGGGNVSVSYLPSSADAKFTVYPNPATELVTLSSAEIVNSILHITDITGRILKTSIISKKETSIDVSSLQPGVYIFYLKGAGAVKVAKK